MKSRSNAFTLVELLVVMGMMVSIMIILIGMFKGARGSFEYGNSRIGMQQRAREAIKRVTVLVVSGIDSGATPERAIHVPAADGASDNQLVFCTTEDVLVPESSNPANRSKLWNPVTQPQPPIFRYRIRYDNAQRRLVLERGTPGQDLLTPAAFLPDPNTPSRILADSDSDRGGARLTGVTFTRQRANAVRVSVQFQGTVRSASGVERDITYDLDSVVQLPAVQ
ncbi:MAG: hypothetical protein AB1758_18210 [Candidatus Eremiobacterota bacterium]